MREKEKEALRGITTPLVEPIKKQRRGLKNDSIG